MCAWRRCDGNSGMVVSTMDYSGRENKPSSSWVSHAGDEKKKKRRKGEEQREDKQIEQIQHKTFYYYCHYFPRTFGLLIKALHSQDYLN